MPKPYRCILDYQEFDTKEELLRHFKRKFPQYLTTKLYAEIENMSDEDHQKTDNVKTIVNRVAKTGNRGYVKAKKQSVKKTKKVAKEESSIDDTNTDGDVDNT